MKPEFTNCPYCKSLVEVDISWAIHNERIFCGSCCKAFEIRVGEETKEVQTEKTTKKWDEGIKKIFEDDEEPNFDWDEF